MPSERIKFTNNNGHELAGFLDMPESGSPKAFALFAHCFTCGKNLKPIVNINRALTNHGIAVLRFDFTGIGESEGEFSETNFSSTVDDLIAAAEYLDEHHKAPTLLIGHSMGGAAVLQAAHDIPFSKAVVTIAAPSNPNHLSGILQEKREKVKSKGAADVTIGGKTFTLTKQFFRDLEQTRMEGFIRDLERALLILHSPQDDTVDIRNAAEIFQTARHPKSYVSLDEMGHLMLEEDQAKYVGNLIAAWADRYVSGSGK
ncbi:MAG: lysophospholipase [Candidatus Marinimicrobia bacterium]|nr:lysophospholipase [Candidatus Neomarinimicrobiota bacterium]MCF7828351.1 lysophospholipase [Candidatus Neomarinimicrobiota bacterium]MCF7881056.1 lysophospholipase [Candidatus Neomarinimicrobiota bacterium]